MPEVTVPNEAMIINRGKDGFDCLAKLMNKIREVKTKPHPRPHDLDVGYAPKLFVVERDELTARHREIVSVYDSIENDVAELLCSIRNQFGSEDTIPAVSIDQLLCKLKDCLQRWRQTNHQAVYGHS